MPLDGGNKFYFWAKSSVQVTMRIASLLSLAWVWALFLYSSDLFAREYMVYGIDQEIPMGKPGEIVKKNYYVNMGGDQGLDLGTVLNVYRVVSRTDPYNSYRRYNHRMKIAEIKIIHVEKNSAVAGLASLRNSPDDPVFDIAAVMIGDRVEVNVD